MKFELSEEQELLQETIRGFLDAECRYLVCATHGAIFRLCDGVCMAGPCQGDGLRAITCEVRDGAIWATSLPPSAAR